MGNGETNRNGTVRCEPDRTGLLWTSVKRELVGIRERGPLATVLVWFGFVFVFAVVAQFVCRACK